MSWFVLWSEIDTDPLGRGYAGMTDSQIVADLNTSYRERNRASMSADEIFNAIDIAEYKALAAADKEMVQVVLGMGSVNPFGRAADAFVDAFGGGSTTITTLQALRKENITRAQELGLRPVTEGMVIEAKTQGAV